MRRLIFRSHFLLLTVFAAGMTGATARADDDPLVTAVFAKADPDYVRATNPDGTPATETYLVAKGGYMSGPKRDDSIDDIKFSGLVRALAKYMAPMNYFPARVPKDAKLMLVIYWGTSASSDNPRYRSDLVRAGEAMAAAMQPGGTGAGAVQNGGGGGGAASGEQLRAQDRTASQQALADAAEEALFELKAANSSRQKTEEFNANLLGYMQDINYYHIGVGAGGGDDHYRDLLSDIQEERYYVIIGAYDFQEMVQHQKKKLLWSTRVSIRARGNRFDERLFAMLDNASKFFGKDSGGLRKHDEKTPRVNLGELKILGVAEPSAPADKPSPDAPASRTDSRDTHRN